jgi:hypothetical protein
MDSKRKIEGDGFPRSKKLTRRVKRADAMTELVVVLGLRVFLAQFRAISRSALQQFLEVLYGHGISYF